MSEPYDSTNIFARIVDGDIPADFIAENKNALSFYDLHPVAKIHALVIPKGAYQNFSEFNKRASDEEKKDFWNLVEETTHILEKEHAEEGLEPGFRLITNEGPAAGQEIEHFHIHILAGEKLGKLNAQPQA